MKTLSLSEKDRLFTLRAWLVHFYTGLGLVAAFMALLAVARHDPFEIAVYLALAGFIDGTDGIMARRWKVKTWTPFFDGRKLDDIIDYLTYVLVPIYAVYEFKLVSGDWTWTLPFVLLASAYGFCNQSAKTDDGYFTGFPSYWNAVAFYMYLLQTSTVTNGIVFIVLGIMVFIPVRYIYLTQTLEYRPLNVTLTLIWFAQILYILVNFQNPDRHFVALSLWYPVYHFALSFYLHYKGGRR
jgi:phosphatidylcholine synthase